MLKKYFSTINNTRKKHKAFLIFVLFALIASVPIKSQNSCGDYSVARHTGITYTSIITTGSTFSAWKNTAGSGVGGSYDDNRSDSTAIGFDFWYLGVRYTSFCVSTNGFMDFSTSTADGTGQNAYGYDNTSFTSKNKTSLLTLAPFYDDQVIGGNVDGTDSLNNYIRYQLNGTAPNRTLVVEWSQMDAYGNITPDLNYQVVLHETTGIIEFNYGTMTKGTQNWSYSCGINGTSMSTSPTAAQLLTQQTANAASFNNSPTDNLSTVPASNTNITFTPPTASGNPSNLTFTSFLQTGVTLNWQDHANNEAGYVIYYSADDVNFYFNTQTAANATSSAVTGLLPGTTYYWEVYAVTDGHLSSAVTGSCTTNPPTIVTSTVTGNWGTTGTWDCHCVPNAGDNVIIADGTTVTINTNATCNLLQVGQGSSGVLTIGSNGTARTLSVSSDLTIKAGATFNTFNSSTTHILTIGGNISNSGTLNFSGTSKCDVTFNANAYVGNIGNQSVSGAGATTTFNNITLNMGSTDTMEVTSTKFTAATGFLTLTSGIFKFSSAATITPFNTSTTISSDAGFWLNNAGAVVTAVSGTSITLQGLIKVTSGTMGIGLAKNDNILCQGGYLTIDGGALTIAGCLTNTDATSITNFSMSSGTLTCAGGGIPTSSGNASFDIQTPGSSFNMSGGTIIIQNEGNGGGYYVDMSSSSDHYSLTGGVLQIGNASTAAASTIQITSTIPVYNLTVNSSNATAQVTSNNLIINNDLTITSGTFNPNSLIVDVGHNFTNNATFTTSGTLAFNGSSAQTLGGSSTTIFNNLSINNTNGTVSGVTVNKTATVNGTLTFSNGIFNTSAANYLIMANAATVSGASNTSYVDGPIQKTGKQVFTFPVGTGGNYQPIGMGAPTNTTDAFTAQYFHSNVYAVPSYTTNTWDNTIGHLSGDEYWILNRTVGTSSVAVTIGWNASSGGVTNLASLTVAKYDAGLNAWKDVGKASTTGNTSAGTITSNIVGSFSPFTLASTSTVGATNPLPIELLDFSAIPNNNKVDLKWETATEINNAYFTIEKSKDGITFTKLIDIPGADNSTSYKEYAETDYQPYTGTSYYRLKQTDYNGVYKYFPMVAVNFDNQRSIRVYPNPIESTSNLSVEVNGYQNQEVLVVLRDIQGREFLSKVFVSSDNSQVFLVDEAKTLTAGTYIVTASSNDKIYNYKLIVK